MDEQDIKKLWKTASEKWEESLVISRQLLNEVQSEKAYSKIKSFRNNQIFVMILGVLWISFLTFLVYHMLDNIYFVVSAGMIIVFNIFAVVLYLKHVIILSSIDITKSIAHTQRKLVQVYTSYTQSGRILLLQAPFFCTFWYRDELVQNAGPVFWSIQLVIVSFFTILSIYLFRKLSIHNPTDKWLKISNRIFGAHKLQNAMEFLREIED